MAVHWDARVDWVIAEVEYFIDNGRHVRHRLLILNLKLSPYPKLVKKISKYLLSLVL